MKTRGDGRRGGALAGWTVALALCACPGAWAATFGTSCGYNGSTLADGGTPSQLVSNANALLGGCGGGSVNSLGTVYGSEWTGDDYFDYSFAQGARTDASASAGLGSLHAYSYSTATSTPMRYLYTSNSGQTVAIDNGYRAYGTSAASAQWFDQITVNQGAHYGTVYLKFTLTLSGTEGVTPAGAGFADISARLIVDDDRNLNDRTLTLTGEDSTYLIGGYPPGTTIKLFGDLTARTEVRAGGQALVNGWWLPAAYIPTAEATANASNSAGFVIEVLTEGASYTSASGHAYVTPVPEPASAWLLGLGTAALLGVARRRR